MKLIRENHNTRCYTYIKRMYHRFGWCLGPLLIGDTLFDAHLLFDTPPPNGHPSCRLHPGGSQDLVATLYPHKQHTEDTHAHRWRSHIQLYLPIKYYTKCIDQINQYHLTQSLSINYYTKSNCHLTQSL
jgi:hypothetical protein